MQIRPYDIAIIGGGLTGAAIARDAAGRGLSVFLCDQADLGGGASSASNKLIHGALALLDGMHLGGMREAVREREIAMRSAPHLVRPLRFVIPHHARQWSKTAFRVGLFAFDHAARHSLPPAGRITLGGDDAYAALQDHFTLGFAYSDCVADDARLVILNALDARDRGAAVYPRLRCTVAEREGGHWRLSLESTVSGEQSVVRAALLVNAAGPSAADVHNHVVHSSRPLAVRYHRISSIVVKRDEIDPVGYALPNADGRVVFVFPWHAGTLLIGSAERDVAAAAPQAAVDAADTAYLLDVVRQYFHTPAWRQDIVLGFNAFWAQPEGRDDAIVIDAPPHVPPLVTVLGVPLTGHRRFAERVVGMLSRQRKIPPAWTARAVLPGGGFPAKGGGDLVRALRAAYPFLAERHAARLVRAYGTRASMILTGARSADELGARFGADLTEAEVRYLVNEEWAATAEDVLWRRSKLGLVLSGDEQRALAGWMAARPAVPAMPL